MQTPACDAFLQMQAAAAADGVTIWMQSGYRSVEYQTKLYTNKTNYYLNQGFDEATAKEKAAGIVNPPGYSEHNCGLAADLNSPEHTELTEGFEDTAAFRWLQQHAGEYGFILRYPKGMEAFTEDRPTSLGTGAMWGWRMPPESTPAACVLSSTGMRCKRPPRAKQPIGETTVKAPLPRCRFVAFWVGI